MIHISDKTQNGALLLRETGLGEWGILRAERRKITQAIYWNSRQDMINDLKKIIKEATA